MRACIFIFITTILAGCFGASPEKTGKEGQEMPDFAILLANKTILHTRDIAMGKPIVLFYFSPFCHFCNKLTKDILGDIEQFSDVQFLFVTSYSQDQLEEFKKSYNLAKYPNITIGVDTAHFIHNYFPANGVPYTAIYNKNKILNKTFLGSLSTGQLAKVVDE